MNRDWGHVQIAGILRQMEWDDATPTPFDASGDEMGWGVNLSSNIKFDENTLRLQVVFGEGIQNYMNDATVDVGATGDANIAEALPVLGVVAFYDLAWNTDWTSSFGVSYVDMDNSAAQSPSAFKQGQYAIVNLLSHSVNNLMWGGELQYGKRELLGRLQLDDALNFHSSASNQVGRINRSSILSGGCLRRSSLQHTGIRSIRA
jgi:hypothetical protein